MTPLNAAVRTLRIALILALALCPASAQRVAPAHTLGAAIQQRPPLVQAVGAINMTVSDLDRSVKFYSQVLRFRLLSERTTTLQLDRTTLTARTADLSLGDERIALMQYSKAGKPVPADSRSNDLWFQHIAIIVSDMDQAYSILEAHGVERISPSPQRLPDWNRNAAGIRAFYFKDPDGHPLEILWFPAGKGAAKWHRPARDVFLGLDHTAITVSDTVRSLAFYHDLMGMHVAGQSENYGPEQESLNNVPGAHLRITSLRAESGPGIELLEYVAPLGGRQIPEPPQVIDIIHRHTELIAAHPAAVRLAASTHEGKTEIVPVGLTVQPETVLIHDPDGHELLVRTK